MHIGGCHILCQTVTKSQHCLWTLSVKRDAAVVLYYVHASTGTGGLFPLIVIHTDNAILTKRLTQNVTCNDTSILLLLQTFMRLLHVICHNRTALVVFSFWLSFTLTIFRVWEKIQISVRALHEKKLSMHYNKMCIWQVVYLRSLQLTGKPLYFGHVVLFAASFVSSPTTPHDLPLNAHFPVVVI